MLITNYFHVSSSKTVQSEMIEKLKQANEELGDNPQLQEQIRELDLLARKAYFINIERLRIGIAILLSMVVIFVVSLRIFFANNKDIPGKVIDPIDEWAIKSKSRKFIVWFTGGLAIAGIVFALLSSAQLKNFSQKKNIKIHYSEVFNDEEEIQNDFSKDDD